MSNSTGSLTGRTLVALFREEYDAMVSELAQLRAELEAARALRAGSYQPVEGKQAGILDSTLDVDYDRHMHLRLEIHARDGDSPSVIWLSNEYALCRQMPGAAQVPVEAVPQADWLTEFPPEWDRHPWARYAYLQPSFSHHDGIMFMWIYFENEPQWGEKSYNWVSGTHGYQNPVTRAPLSVFFDVRQTLQTRPVAQAQVSE